MIINMRKYQAGIIIAVILCTLTGAACILRCNKPTKIPQHEPSADVRYGEFMPWEQVNHLFPKYSEADIIDFETGWHFRVQRRGGTYHTDVQPLTAQDTTIMKKIYNGKWSWKRRAVIVKLDSGQKIAASINGMPHGQGSIKNNEFNGHFCIHFRDSKTHCSTKVDTAHQLMIWKAANILDKQLGALDARNTIENFVAALDQGDVITASKLIDFGSNNSLLLLELSNINSIKINQIEEKNADTFNVGLWVKFKNSEGEWNKKLTINMISRNSSWKIAPVSLTSLLKKNNPIGVNEVRNVIFEEDWESGI